MLMPGLQTLPITYILILFLIFVYIVDVVGGSVKSVILAILYPVVPTWGVQKTQCFRAYYPVDWLLVA